MKINCFSFSCYVKHIPHTFSLALSLMCNLGIDPLRPPNPTLKQIFPLLLLSAELVDCLSSDRAADPRSFPPFLPVHYGYLKLVQHDITSLLELPEEK